jgi:hypothetical protein
MLLGALRKRQRQLALVYAEKTRSRVHKLLPGIASDEGYGKFVMLIVHDHDAYYRYITNHYTDVPDAEELAFSSGMYINHGYGLFVSPPLSAGAVRAPHAPFESRSGAQSPLLRAGATGRSRARSLGRSLAPTPNVHPLQAPRLMCATELTPVPGFAYVSYGEFLADSSVKRVQTGFGSLDDDQSCLSRPAGKHRTASDNLIPAQRGQAVRHRCGSPATAETPRTCGAP